MLVVEFQRFLERTAKRLQEVQRSAEKEHFSLNPSPLRQSRHRLVHHGLKDRSGNIRFCRALIEQRLNVRLCKYSAPRSDRICLFGTQSQFVHFGNGNIEKRRHLIDKGARPARTAPVHALFGSARQENNFRVLAAQLYRRVRVGIIMSNRDKSSLYLLHEGNAALFRQTQPRASRNGGTELLTRKKGSNLFQFS